MPGIGTFLGTIADMFGSKAERRRNLIKKLEREYDQLKKGPATTPNIIRMERITADLKRLYDEAKNA